MIQDLKPYLDKFDSKFWRGIVIHHSLSENRHICDWGTLKKTHTQKYGYHDIGYHFGVEYENGKIVCRVGRTLHQEGTHTDGADYSHIGVCLIGDFDVVPPNNDQYRALADLCCQLMDKFTIRIYNVLPHWSFSDRTCPGKMFDMLKLREYIKGCLL